MKNTSLSHTIYLPIVSIIIPMYNFEKYVAEGLDSILEQTFQDYEVIIINDCSTDNSRQIAQNYLEKFDGRLKIYDNEKNSGPSFSRNRGLFFAQGEYVFFMDADDMLLPNALANMYKFAKKFDADVVSFKLRCNTSEDGKELSIVEHRQPRLLLDEILVDYVDRLEVVAIEDLQTIRKTVKLKYPYSWRQMVLSQNRFPWEIWLKFSKRRFLIENELFFNENIYLAEDHVWTYGIFLYAKKIVHVPRVLYHHRSSKQSIVRTRRNFLQKINLWISVIINGMKWVDDIMGNLDFFRKNPTIRYNLLEAFTRRYFRDILKITPKLQQYDIYASIKQDFGENFGAHAVLISQLITFVNTNQKKILELEEQINANKETSLSN